MFVILNLYVLLLGHFIVPSFNWYSGIPSINFCYYTKQKTEVICSSICFPDISQYSYFEGGINLLEFFFSNIADFTIYSAKYCIVQPTHYHPPLTVGCLMFKINYA